jgi:hypothetical protein
MDIEKQIRSVTKGAYKESPVRQGGAKYWGRYANGGVGRKENPATDWSTRRGSGPVAILQRKKIWGRWGNASGGPVCSVSCASGHVTTAESRRPVSMSVRSTAIMGNQN